MRGGDTAEGVGGTLDGGNEGGGAGAFVTGGAGGVAHPTSHSQASAKLQWRNQCLYPTMWIILLEAALALALLVFIVWWTMFDKPRKKD